MYKFTYKLHNINHPNNDQRIYQEMTFIIFNPIRNNNNISYVVIFIYQNINNIIWSYNDNKNYSFFK